MKSACLALSIFLLSSGPLLAGNALEGQVFERTFEAQPLGALTPMSFTHTLSFGSDWTVTDNSSTWFGNPPNKCAYGVEWTRDRQEPGRITLICNGRVSQFKYVKKADTVTLNGKGLSLTLKNQN